MEESQQKHPDNLPNYRSKSYVPLSYSVAIFLPSFLIGGGLGLWAFLYDFLKQFMPDIPGFTLSGLALVALFALMSRFFKTFLAKLLANGGSSHIIFIPLVCLELWIAFNGLVMFMKLFFEGELLYHLTMATIIAGLGLTFLPLILFTEKFMDLVDRKQESEEE
jgi:hypothetical protein